MLPKQPKYLSNGNKNNIFIEANIINNSAKFQLYPPTSEELIFIFFYANLTFWLPWQPIKLRGLV